MKLISLLLNLFWVMRAFLRGKVLRQKAYWPDSDGMFRATPGATYKRMAMLIRWWGYRPATLPELLKKLSDKAPEYLNDDFPVVALGSIYTEPDNGKESITVRHADCVSLYFDSDGEYMWNTGFRFMATREGRVLVRSDGTPSRHLRPATIKEID